MNRLFALLAALLAVASPVAALAKSPNVVVFVADDLGWRDLGYAGSTFYETPNIDALAARGMAFTNAYSACPVCSPTRAALMTGRYPARVGVTDFIGGPQPAVAATQPRFKDRSMLPAPYLTHLPLEETTVGEAFKQAGYSTFFAGKWHLGGNKKYYPDKQGFDTTVGVAGGVGKGGFLAPFSKSLELAPGPEGEPLDPRLARETANWIAKQPKDKPFLAWFCLYDPHIPLMAPADTVKYFEAKRERLGLSDDFADEGQRKNRLTQSHALYAAMVKTMDDAVGIVVKQLQEQGLLDDTVILFTSDNGGVSTSEGNPTSNVPLRAGKGWAYEGGIRVPLVVVAPGITQPGTKSDARAVSTDIFPTLLAACGLPPRPDAHVDGTSLLPALQGKPLPDAPLFWHYPHYGNQGGQPFSAVRSGNWKLISFHDPAKGTELYDLANDPREQSNLAEKEPARVKELADTLSAWKKWVGAKDATLKEDSPADAANLPGESRIILPPTEQFPRFSEGDVIELTDGRLFLAVGRKDGASDFARGTIVGMFSKDGGKTWDGADGPQVIRSAFADRVDLMSVSLFRTKRGIHLLFLARSEQAKSDTLVYQILSTDEGKTWGEPTRVSVRPGYHVVNNARVIRTSSRRLLVPASYVEAIDRGIKGRRVIVIYSDDDGVTWRESEELEIKDVALMEPGVAECPDGSIYMTIRTALGVLYEARSRDGGATWQDLGPTKLPAPAAPSTVVRAPDGSDELWLFWCNNAKANWKQRTPQVFARSKDNGKSWSAPRVIEHDPKHGYGYISVTRVKDEVLLTYYDWEDRGQPSFQMTSLRQRTIPLSWFRAP